MTFSTSQKKAVSLMEGPAMILAGPGSGKTMVITHRIRHLIDSGVRPDNILVITFTRAAAMQMRSRFLSLTGGEDPRVTFGTFHAVFFQILRNAYHYTYDSILREDERFRILAGLGESLRLDTDDMKSWVSDISAEISQVKTEKIPLDYYYSSNCPEEDFRRLYRGYEEQKQRMRKIDFDDMCCYTADLFHARKDILSSWQNHYRYILIDEFQDINSLQYEIVRELAEPQRNLFIVGDDDQSIYRFRGSKPEIMLNFPKDYPDAKVITLEENYRSTASIVDASLAVIEENRSRFRKDLHSVSEKGDPVKVLECRDPATEYLYLVSAIRKSITAGVKPGDIAILTRTNLQARGPAEKLMEFSIPVSVRDSMPNLYDHFTAQDFLAYLRMSRGERSVSDFLRICNRPNRYISRESVEASSRRIEGRAVVSFPALMSYYRDKPWMCDRIRKMEDDLTRLSSMKMYAALNYIRMGIGYDAFLKEYAEKRKLNLEELTDTENELQEAAKPFEQPKQWEAYIEDYRKKMEELRRESSGDGEKNQESVTLSTFHSAKGLEFYEVFLLDVNEGTIPYKKASLPAEIEEERRLFYVGMTRAEKKLHILYVKERYNKKLEPSRFLDALRDGDEGS